MSAEPCAARGEGDGVSDGAEVAAVERDRRLRGGRLGATAAGFGGSAHRVEGVGAQVGERAEDPLRQQRVGVVEQLGQQVDGAGGPHVLPQLPGLFAAQGVDKGRQVERAASAQLWLLRGAGGGGGEGGMVAGWRV